jgi:hypothetical protein
MLYAALPELSANNISKPKVKRPTMLAQAPTSGSPYLAER